MTPKAELVSIGLPVYNGGRYLASALKSLLDQDYANLELIVSDNASTDDTEEICRRFAQEDSRITFRRNESNVGSATNFNTVFELSRGQYFMWAAHDDLWHPHYIRRCAEVLRHHHDVVLCSTDIDFMDEQGQIFSYEHYNRLHTHGMDLRQRVRAVTEKAGWFSFYGLLRPEVLRRTRRYMSVYGGDVILLMELMFHGSTFVLPERLFSKREGGRTTARYIRDITGVANVPARFTPYTDLARSLLRVIDESSVKTAAKAAMRRDLLRNVCDTNKWWRSQMTQEHPVISCMPPYRQSVELRALMTQGINASSLWLRRAVSWIHFMDTHLRPVTPNVVLRAVRMLRNVFANPP
jgi:glycosyltransferase involved in cell wall biosynthesis